MTNRISQASLQPALSRLDAAGFIAALPETPWAEKDVAKLERFLLRAGELVCKMPDPKRAARRDSFVETLLAYLGSLDQPEIAERLAAVFEVQALVQGGYTSLRAALDAAPTRSRPAASQAAIALSRMSEYGDVLMRDAEAARTGPPSRAGPLNLNDEVMGIDETGQPYSIDGVTGALLADLKLVLVMLGHEASWFDAAGLLRLPSDTDIGSAPAEDGEPVQVLAAFWRRWERLEQRRRYWGGDWAIFDVEPDQRYAGPQCDKLLFYEASEDELFDWAANARSKEVSIQGFARALIMGLKIGSGSTELEAEPPPLAPRAAIREHEVNGAGYLTSVLGQNIFDDDRAFAGIRLVEWLRGYSALGLIASDALEAASALDRHLVEFGPGDLEARLLQEGLSPEAARVFTGHASLCAKSHDLFDTPIIALTDGGHLLIGPACVNADPGKVTLSRLTHLKAAPADKGDLFEAAVHDLLRSHGLESFTIDTTRGGDPYQLDVVLPWGEYLFVIECKNRGLSDGDPVAGRYFLDQVEDFVDQVARHVAGLRAYPDMSVAAGGVDPNAFEIIPVVLYSEPFSLPQGLGGTYVTDWSALTRFFSERYFFSLQPHALKGQIRVLHRIALYDQWGSDAPSPEAFLKFLRDAPQARYMLSRAEPREEKFPLSNSLCAGTVEIAKGDVDLEAMADMFGFDPDWVEAERAKVSKEIERIREALKAKAQ